MECRSPYSESGPEGGGGGTGVLPAGGAAPAQAPLPDETPQESPQLARQPAALTPLDQFVRELLARRLKQTLKQWRRCARKAGPEEIHDLRVSLRRFGENLWLFRRVFPKRERRQVRDEVKLVMRLTAACRDADIALESFAKAGVVATPSCGLALENARATAEMALVAALAAGLRTDVTSRWRATLRLDPESATPDAPQAEAEAES